MPKYKNSKLQNIAKERIGVLFRQARLMFKEEPNLANRYVQLARKIAMRCKVKMPHALKRQFCKNCHKFLMPGKNLRVRLHKGRTIYYCLECKHFMRFPNRDN